MSNSLRAEEVHESTKSLVPTVFLVRILSVMGSAFSPVAVICPVLIHRILIDPHMHVGLFDTA